MTTMPAVASRVTGRPSSVRPTGTWPGALTPGAAAWSGGASTHGSGSTTGTGGPGVASSDVRTNAATAARATAHPTIEPCCPAETPASTRAVRNGPTRTGPRGGRGSCGTPGSPCGDRTARAPPGSLRRPRWRTAGAEPTVEECHCTRKNCSPMSTRAPRSTRYRRPGSHRRIEPSMCRMTDPLPEKRSDTHRSSPSRPSSRCVFETDLPGSWTVSRSSNRSPGCGRGRRPSRPVPWTPSCSPVLQCSTNGARVGS